MVRVLVNDVKSIIVSLHRAGEGSRNSFSRIRWWVWSGTQHVTKNGHLIRRNYKWTKYKERVFVLFGITNGTRSCFSLGIFVHQMALSFVWLSWFVCYLEKVNELRIIKNYFVC